MTADLTGWWAVADLVAVAVLLGCVLFVFACIVVDLVRERRKEP
jgi:hypothetical protein